VKKEQGPGQLRAIIEEETRRLRLKTGDDQARFSDKVLGDIKRFIAFLLFLVLRFY